MSARLGSRTGAIRPMIIPMATALDRVSTHPAARLLVVVGWFVISAIAFFTRYERFTPALAALMGGLIVVVGGLGLTWALLPAKGKRRRSRA